MYLIKPCLTILTISLILGLITFVVRRLKSTGRTDPLIPPDMATALAPPGPSDPSPKPAISQIGPYQIVVLIGQGGMGTVFKAIDPKGRPVAIKMIGGRGQDRRAKAKEDNRIGLVREARLAADLHHPNIVEIYDVGQEQGTLYVVMEYLEGASLDKRIRDQSVSVLEGLGIVAELCDALSCASSRGVVHRDIKPQNTFVTSDGRVKVLDFGLAFLRTELKGRPTSGTLPYMSPEQIRGGDIDFRSDIWSAGITLFEILTCQLPFGSDGFTPRRIISAVTPKLTSNLPHVDELQAILSKALAKNRDLRYSSARDFAADLRSLMSRMKEVSLLNRTNTSSADIVEVRSEKPWVPFEEGGAQRYKHVNLGFSNAFTAQVVIIEPRFDRKDVGFGESALKGIAFLSFALVVLGGILSGSLEGTMQLAAQIVALGGLGLLVLILIAALVLRLLHIANKIFRSPKSVKCRSCLRKMRIVSVWIRPVWLVERAGFCVPDCIAALREGLWEEAVKLLWVHTTDESTDTQFKLEFLECKHCQDQRAHLRMENKDSNQWVPVWIIEAYKFRDFQFQKQFIAKARLRGTRTVVTATSNRDIHGQTTL